MREYRYQVDREGHIFHDGTEIVDAATLEHDGTRLFCRVRKGAFSARFGRLAMQQIAAWLGDDGTGPAITLGGRHWPLGAIRPRAHTSQPRTQTK